MIKERAWRNSLCNMCEPKSNMRLRNVPGARETIEANEMALTEECDCKGKWKEIFGNENELHIEIGMGKGQFITTLAKQNPDINYVGIEKYSSVLVRALEKCEEEEIPNLKFLRIDAENIEDFFEEGEVDKIYLNFSDPWPKDRHAKRRLTSSRFLARYDKILRKDGVVEFKSSGCWLEYYRADMGPSQQRGDGQRKCYDRVRD